MRLGQCISDVACKAIQLHPFATGCPTMGVHGTSPTVNLNPEKGQTKGHGQGCWRGCAHGLATGSV